jgi:methyl-accepting chemotaxis protein
MSRDTNRDPRKGQRRTLLVKRALQIKYIGMAFFSILLASLFVGGDVYYSLVRVMQTECPTGLEHATQVNGILMLKGSIYLLIMILIALYISHRIAGPLYRFEKSAQIVGTGDLSHRVSLRTGDELIELQEEFNGMVASLQSIVEKDRNLAKRLSDRVEDLAKRASQDELRRELRDLKVEIAHLTKSFKI